MKAPPTVSFVLHAHLPWVQASGGEISLEEAWLYEAMWECYLPLCALCEELAQNGPEAPVLTLSLSPTLLAMLSSAQHRRRFERYADELAAALERARAQRPELEPAVSDHLARLNASRATFERVGRDLTGALVALHRQRVIELGTTAATHAFLPGLLSDAAARAQLRMGARYFQRVTREHARTLWLPECGYDERLEQTLVDSGAFATVLASHGLTLARPRPPFGTDTPLLADQPFAFFARADHPCSRIWSPDHGYPAHPSYREFYRRAPLEQAGSALDHALKPFSVTSAGPDKEPYLPLRARATVKEHARDFLRSLRAHFAGSRADEPICVLAFDAELFGHWWWEGPQFLAAVLADAPAAGLSPRALVGYLERDPVLPVGRPASSSWGRGGYSDVWTHPSSAHALRLCHRAERRVLSVDALVRDTPRSEVQRRARLLAIRELFLLQASDWPFMLRSGEFAGFAERRLNEHASLVDELANIAERGQELPGDKPRIHTLEAQRALFAELDEDAWADAFDPW